MMLTSGCSPPSCSATPTGLTSSWPAWSGSPRRDPAPGPPAEGVRGHPGRHRPSTRPPPGSRCTSTWPPAWPATTRGPPAPSRTRSGPCPRSPPPTTSPGRWTTCSPSSPGTWPSSSRCWPGWPLTAGAAGHLPAAGGGQAALPAPPGPDPAGGPGPPRPRARLGRREARPAPAEPVQVQRPAGGGAIVALVGQPLGEGWPALASSSTVADLVPDPWVGDVEVGHGSRSGRNHLPATSS